MYISCIRFHIQKLIINRVYKVQIHDGMSVNDATLLLKNQVVLEKSRKDLPPAVYSTGKSALIHIDHAKLLAASKMAPVNAFQLRIAKVLVQIQNFYLYLHVKTNVIIQAVNCPFNLGAESQCGRILDDQSCYCATFTLV